MKIEARSLRSLGGVRHGFFGRQGGVSEGHWASLNMGLRSGDRPDAVATNRARVAEALGVKPPHLVTARQVHGVAAVPVTEPWDNLDAPEADALVTDRPGLLLGVLTADCGPILLADESAGVIGAAHAGWRGAFDGVIEAVVAAMARLGARRECIVAVLGPCIGPRSYEVGPEFLARFVAEDAANRDYFDESGERPRFDLRGFIASRLWCAGVADVEVVDRDTCAEDELFFSFRRSTLRREERFGLQISGIVLDT
ncbi:MAG: peptidoglycan editing factor PgeF [Geminicoccaceae bacterium]